MDFKHGLTALPEELQQKLAKIPSWKEFGQKNKDWNQDLLDKLFKDIRRELNTEEQSTFYRCLLQSVAFATKNVLEPYIEAMKPAIDSGLTKSANDLFKPGTKAGTEMAKMVIQTNQVILLLCNIYEAQVDNGEMPVEELNDAILDIAEMTGTRDHFKRAEVVYNSCKKISESADLYPAAPKKKQGGSGFKR